MNITDVRYGNSRISKVYYNNAEVNMPSLTFDKLFDYNDYLNIHTNYDYKPIAQYYGKYIKLKPDTTYVVSVSAGVDVGLVLINNRQDAYTGSYIDFRKDTAQAKQFVTDEKGYLYLVCSTSLSESTYNNIITNRNIKILEA